MTVDALRAKIKSAADKMRADDNTKNAIRYLEHLTWLLFLKVFESVEDDRALVAQVDKRDYSRVIDGEYRWSEWTNAGLSGDDLTKWVTEKLLPHLRELGGSSEAEKIAQLFNGVTTVMKSGYALAEVISIVNEIEFHALADYHAMSVIYESLLVEQTADAGWSGEFYTPRPVVEFMVKVVDPKIGESIYDPCFGSAGFLVAGAEHLRPEAKTSEDEEILEAKTIYGQEAGDIAYLVGTMNLLLHAISEPQTIRRNTLEQDIRSIGLSEQHDVILTNPPFGGSEHPSVQQNFPARSAATELLFLQHCMAKLRAGGRCAIVLPDGILYRTETSFSTVRRRLLSEFGITAIVRMPTGAFPTAADTRTNLVFFTRGDRPAAIRYYQVHPPEGKRSYSKLNPLPPEALEGAYQWLVNGVADDNAWPVSYEDIEQGGYDLDIPWPNGGFAGTGADAPERLEELMSRSATIREIAEQLLGLAESVDQFEIAEMVTLDGRVEERGARAGELTPEQFVGVSNDGGLGPFKGKPAADTARYRRLEIGDFVYNPMRVNVGSIALCRRAEEQGWVSPDYVVFRLRDDAPFSTEYLLTYLKSEIGKAEITLRSRGAVRRRLYYENLEQVRVPLPADPEQWESVLAALASARRHLRDLPGLGRVGLSALEESLFAATAGASNEATPELGTGFQTQTRSRQ